MNLLRKKKKKETEPEEKIRKSQESPALANWSDADKKIAMEITIQHVKDYYHGKRRHLSIELH